MMQQVRLTPVVDDPVAFIKRILLVKQVDVILPFRDDARGFTGTTGLIVDPSPYTYSIARNVAFNTLLDPSFVEDNAVRSKNVPNPVERGDLAVVALDARIDSGNSLCITQDASKIRLTIDRETYYDLGLTHSRKLSKFHRQKSIEQGDFFGIEVALIKRDSSKRKENLAQHNHDCASEALDSKHVGTMSLAMSRGRNRVQCPQSILVTEHYVRAESKSFKLPSIPDLATVLAQTSCASYEDDCLSLINWFSILLRPLPDFPIPNPPSDTPTLQHPWTIDTQSYRGFCNSHLAEDVLKKIQRAVDREDVPYAVIMVHAYSDAPIIFRGKRRSAHRASATPSFGGDAAIGLLVCRNRRVVKYVGFEVMAKQDF